MIEDIKRIGIDDKLYNEMINTLGYDTVLNMACNYKLIMQNISVLLNHGINDITSLLLYKEYILMKDTKDIEYALRKCNIPNISELINSDYTNIDLLFN